MSNGFYNYIARNIIGFFQNRQNLIRNGERYCLKLDTDDIVKGVDDALRELTELDGIQGQYSHNGIYNTFTIKINDKIEVVVASKINGMTNDYLATLRNAELSSKRFPILMITQSTIDTISSGTGDLSAVGMPFHVGTIIDNIKRNIETAQLSPVDQALLENELNLKQSDKYSDKSSLYEYRDLLTVLGRGQVLEEDYSKFMLLPDPDISAWVDKSKINDRINENREIFERIDRTVKHGNIIETLEKEFDRAFIDDLISKKKSGIPWYEELTFTLVKASKDKLKRKIDNPLIIQNSDLEIYSKSPLEYRFVENVNYFIRDDGDTKAKQRKKNIIIYNSDRKEEITVDISTNIYIKPSCIEISGLTADASARTVTLHLKSDTCIFASAIVSDLTNNIKYEFKFCVIELKPDYLDSIRTAYTLYIFKRNLKKSRIQVSGLTDELVINPDHEKMIYEIATNGGTFICDYDSTLTLKIDPEFNTSDTGKLDCNLQCGNVIVPIQIQDEPVKPVLLTGVALFKKKYAETKSLEYKSGKIITGTEEFYGTDQLKKYLSYEELFIKNKWFAMTDDVNGLKELSINIDDKVKCAYLAFIDVLNKKRTLPSMAYYSDELYEAADLYVKAVEEVLHNIISGQSLSQEQNDILMLGCIVRNLDNTIIEMSPLHPLNVLYQLTLAHESGVGDVREMLVERLSPLYLLPYIKDSRKELYHAVEQKDSPEWRIYAPFTDKRYQGTRNYVQKLICDKINAYRGYFSFLFEDIGNPQICINLVNMGDCREVFRGIVLFYIRELKEKSINELLSFNINIYSDDRIANEFSLLADQKKLKTYLRGTFSKDIDDINEMEQILTKNIRCFFRNPAEEKYQYAHLTFYEMPISKNDGSGQVSLMNTGISLEGIMSGMPSVLNSEWYKTGFGMKYAPKNRLTSFATSLNAMFRVAFSGSSYEPNQCIFTEIEKGQEVQQAKIYDSSNWVVFVDPKVDLSYFQKKPSDESALMIIHYSDQCTSSNGYDDITVTRKTEQYNEIICEQLAKKGVTATKEDVNNIISLFNAVNGSWMLRLITAKKLSGAADSFFSREKMSILSAIKLCMAYYAHPNIVWIPISLEEMLRVSGGAGYSQKDGLLSARNLGFETRATSDDILLVGIEKSNDKIKVYLHPVEVKIGLNSPTVIEKAKTQVLHTFEGLWKALWPDEDRDKLELKMSRNFFMQLVIVCCEKMKLYKVYPNETWDLVLDTYREQLLNEQYEFSHDLDELIGQGTIVSFKSDVLNHSGIINNNVCLLEFPEKKGSVYMIYSTEQIEEELNQAKTDLPRRLIWDYTSRTVECIEEVKQEIIENIFEPDVINEDDTVMQSGPIETINNDKTIEDSVEVVDSKNFTDEKSGIQVLFGTDLSDGSNLIWNPNDTNQVFHTNTGIIGTMGTGKTQFTKSLITQVYRERDHNLDNCDIGILIFDYKGDYNESKMDFIRATDAKVFKPYHLPFNPLALTKSNVFKPLLPIHTANSFKDTLAKIYQLGPKQQNTLFQCIIDTYAMAGIMSSNPSSWDREAPTFEQVYQRYVNDEEIKKTDSLAAAMDKLHQFEIFESNPDKTKSLFEILKGVIVIDLSGYDADIQSLIVAITLDLFYSQMQAAGSSKIYNQLRQLTKLILVDEADNFMSEGFPALKRILKEGREFGVGTILSTQFLNHFGAGEDDYSKYILTWVVHNVADLKSSDVDFVFKTEAKSQESNMLYNSIKSLKKHNSIVKIGNNKPKFIRDKAFWELMQE